MAFFSERKYDSATDRLFLAYYALPAEIVNDNGWGVSNKTIDRNIRSFKGKPVCLKKKDLANPMDIIQQGNYVHPKVPDGSTFEDLVNYQENYAVGIIQDVKLNPQKGYRFELEITDPAAKEAFKSEEYKQDGFPPYVSPYIVTFTQTNPGQNLQQIEQWQGAHIAFVDQPAYGFELMKAAARCLGSEIECKPVMLSASKSNIVNFCVKGAMKDLLQLGAGSSQSSDHQISDNINMSINNTTSGNVDQNQVRTSLTTTPEGREFTISTNDKNIEEQRKSDNVPAVGQSEKENNNNNNNNQNDNKNKIPSFTDLNEANKHISELYQQLNGQKSVLERLEAQQAKFNKTMEDLAKKERIATLKNIVPRQSFKSEEKWLEEIENAYNMKGVNDDFLRRYYENELLVKTITSQKGAAKEKYATMSDIPDFTGHAASKNETTVNTTAGTGITSSSRDVLKLYNLVNRITGQRKEVEIPVAVLGGGSD